MMYKQELYVGVAPVKRCFLSMETAKREKDEIMARIRGLLPESVHLVDIDDAGENGIAFLPEHVAPVVEKFHNAKIDALFLPFCDFGEEQVSSAIAASFKVPVLVWGPRDEVPNTAASRGRDTQCGMFAATKVLRRFGVTYSYIFNCRTRDAAFADGFVRFLRVAAVVKAMKTLRIAKIGARPAPFLSVMTNEADLVSRFGIVTVPISPYNIADLGKNMIAQNDSALTDYVADLRGRMDCRRMTDEAVLSAAAIKLATQQLMNEAGCNVGAMECWSAFPGLMGLSPCLTLGEMSDAGLPLACEADVNGAVTLAMLRACGLYEQAAFLADLTIRHPENENAELLWHCGPFPYSLKCPSCAASLTEGQQNFMLKSGDLTVCRFDDLNGDYYLFAGEGKTTTGPETINTYTWFEVDDWKRWEEKLIQGPYIHHLGAIYGRYLPVLRETARYLGLIFDDASTQGIHSL
ncbi:MAG: fucose isomerase [Bacillota bacterium]